jgi:D-amino peptidase
MPTLVNVPVVFLSGDAGICAEAEAHIPGITTVAVKRGIGDSTINLHPQLAIDRIREGVQKALQANIITKAIKLPDHFRIEIKYKNHASAYRNSFYPGAKLEAPDTIAFETDDYFEVLRLLLFAV